MIENSLLRIFCHKALVMMQSFQSLQKFLEYLKSRPQGLLKNIPATIFTYTKSGSTADNEIDAISGATITTKAVIGAVNGAVRVVTEELKGGE